MSDDRNQKPGNRIDELTRDNAALRRDIEARDVTIEGLRAEIEALRASAAAPQRAGVQAYVLKMKLEHNGVTYPAGAELPFDPHTPPKGCDGLREDVHFHKLHVLRDPRPQG